MQDIYGVSMTKRIEQNMGAGEQASPASSTESEVQANGSSPDRSLMTPNWATNGASKPVTLKTPVEVDVKKFVFKRPDGTLGIGTKITLNRSKVPSVDEPLTKVYSTGGIPKDWRSTSD